MCGPSRLHKVGVKWQETYYIDGAVAFGWVHGTAAFQLYSDSIAFMMRKLGVNLSAILTIMWRLPLGMRYKNILTNYVIYCRN